MYKNYKNNQLLKQQFTPLDLNFNADYKTRNTNVNAELTKPQKDLIEGTLYLQVTLISTIGILALMPESVTNWDVQSLKENPLDQKWKDNVSAGPVWDEDDFVINYIGHPVSGAWYYTMARNDGVDPFGSFIYSFFISTFVWEYGYEAFAEIPSIQDIIATPVVGAFLGEYMYYLEGEIDKNRGEVLGSSTLGAISYFFIDPFGNLANGISNFFNVETTMYFQTYQPYNNIAQSNYDIAILKPQQFSSFDYGFMLNFKY